MHSPVRLSIEYVDGQSHLLVKELYTSPDLQVQIYRAVS